MHVLCAKMKTTIHAIARIYVRHMNWSDHLLSVAKTNVWEKMHFAGKWSKLPKKLYYWIDKVKIILIFGLDNFDKVRIVNQTCQIVRIVVSLYLCLIDYWTCAIIRLYCQPHTLSMNIFTRNGKYRICYQKRMRSVSERSWDSIHFQLSNAIESNGHR